MCVLKLWLECVCWTCLETVLKCVCWNSTWNMFVELHPKCMFWNSTWNLYVEIAPEMRVQKTVLEILFNSKKQIQKTQKQGNGGFQTGFAKPGDKELEFEGIMKRVKGPRYRNSSGVVVDELSAAAGVVEEPFALPQDPAAVRIDLMTKTGTWSNRNLIFKWLCCRDWNLTVCVEVCARNVCVETALEMCVLKLCLKCVCWNCTWNVCVETVPWNMCITTH